MAGGSGRLGSVRVRTTLAASIVVGLALVIGSVALYELLGRALTNDIRDLATTRAEDIASTLETGEPVPLEGDDPDDEFVQILDASGAVAASTSNVEGQPALAQVRPGGSAEIGMVPFEDAPFLVVAVESSDTSEPMVVLVGRNLDDIGDAKSATGRLLVVGVPLLVLVVAAVTWGLTGRALRPV